MSIQPLQSPSAALPSNIRDNHERGSVAEFLTSNITGGDKLSVMSAYFTIHAYHALSHKLNGIDSMRFLFGEPAFLDNLDSEHTQSKRFTLSDHGLTLDERIGGRARAKACAAWIRERNVEIRSVKRPDFLHGKLYFIERGEVRRAISGSSNFTVSGLGLKKGHASGSTASGSTAADGADGKAGPANQGNFELNLVVDSDSDKRDLLKWFDELWNHPLVGDARAQVLAYLEEAYADRDPDFVYQKTLLALFGAAGEREGVQGTEVVGTLENTDIWRALYQFQQHGVKGIISRIAAHGGCVLADSVGLGKTFSALAVIKYFELKATQKARVLVLCPKKLEENWRVYQSHVASKYNPFPDDAFSFTLLAHTDLSRERGLSSGVRLEDVRWDNYDLVVIDESHNLRNRKGARYEKLMRDVSKGGKGTKFLLLSATPVNVDLSDLGAQIALFNGDDNAAFNESLGIRNLKTTLKDAQKAFIKWSLLPPSARTSNALSLALPPAFFHLLDGLTIARSRRQIENHYADSLQEIGAFPERSKPERLKYELDLKGRFLSYASLDAQLSKYSLCVFKPSTYVLDDFKHIYADTTGVANFSQEAREKYLIDMMKINFLKRLESSVVSFGETMERTIQKIDRLIQKLQGFDSLDMSSFGPDFDPDDPDADAELLQALQDATQTGKAVKFAIEHLRRADWIRDLQADRTQLIALQNAALAVTPARDGKLQSLKAFITKKVQAGDLDRDGNPDRKVLVFTAFADTANYLYEQLKTWAKTELNVEVGLVTGASGGVQSTIAGVGDFSAVLAHFSPVSKNRAPLVKPVPVPGAASSNGAKVGAPLSLFGDGAGHGSDAFGLLGLMPDPMPDLAPEAASLSPTAAPVAAVRPRQIDLLIATDCISEGQNLQDCGTLVNFDIHWNPVRIIQRFGRIDRIGSRHKTIQMANFWPVPEIEDYIRLQNRVESRMALAVLTSNGDDNLLEGTQSEISYRDQQLLRLRDHVIDLEEMGESVNFSDFTLEDFRLDLQEFLDEKRRELAEAPEGIFAVVAAGKPTESIKPGFLFCLRRTETLASSSISTALTPALTPKTATPTHYPYAPHYIVYLSGDGETVHAGYMNLKRALDVWKATSLGQMADRDLCNAFDVTIKDGTDMSCVLPALQSAVADIAQTSRKMSLQQAAAGAKMDAPVKVSLEGFELVTWLAII